MSALQGLISNAASDISACYNLGAPFPIVMEGNISTINDPNKYEFNLHDYPSQWIKWQEQLNYGTGYVFAASDYLTYCGSKTYEITCDDSRLNDGVVSMGDEGQFTVSPYMANKILDDSGYNQEVHLTDCTINAYFTDYNPDN